MIARLQRDLKSFAEKDNLSMSIRPPGGGGRGKPVSLVVKGPNNDRLFEISNQILKHAPDKVPNAVNLSSNLKPGRSELQFVVDHVRLSEFGLSTDQVGKSLRGLYEGDLAGNFRELGSEFDIRVRLRPEDRMDLSSLRHLSIPNLRDEPIPITAVTDMVSSSSPTKIVRIDQMRSALIEADLRSNAPLGQVLTDLGAFVKPLVPEGYSFEFQGQAKSLRDLGVGAMMALGLGALFIYMIMASLYESLIIPFSILLTLPLAIVGAILALLISQKNMDIYGVIGMILLMGLVTKNAILLVDYVEQLRAEGKGRIEALREGGKRRLRPIMMTTVAMIAGMLPVAIGYGEVNKIRAGLGIASIGGMMSSTLLSLIVVPCAYIYLDRLREYMKTRNSKA
jgi:HAE1 family hydrophobic/amphiphilic exporter-1